MCVFLLQRHFAEWSSLRRGTFKKFSGSSLLSYYYSVRCYCFSGCDEAARRETRGRRIKLKQQRKPCWSRRSHSYLVALSSFCSRLDMDYFEGDVGGKPNNLHLPVLFSQAARLMKVGKPRGHKPRTMRRTHCRSDYTTRHTDDMTHCVCVYARVSPWRSQDKSHSLY